MFPSPLKQALATARTFADVPMRLAIGVVFIAHGMDKLFGSFGGGGIQATIEQFTQLGLHPAWLQAYMAGGGELLAGILVILGLATRFGGFLLTATMTVAILTVHLPNGLLARDGGFEYPLIVLGCGLYFLLQGAGPISVDAVLYKRFWSGSEAA